MLLLVGLGNPNPNNTNNRHNVGFLVIDEINNQPFSYGVYDISLFIDNKEYYHIEFDRYNFKNDFLVYKEIDFQLLDNQSRNFHKLYIDDNEELNFIKSKGVYMPNLDENFHNLKIIVKDINNNQIDDTMLFFMISNELFRRITSIVMFFTDLYDDV